MQDVAVLGAGGGRVTGWLRAGAPGRDDGIDIEVFSVTFS
jgi:hypothetical protein